jgi:hypothetical protein
MLWLAPNSCTIGIPCAGSVFGMQESVENVIDGLIKALDNTLNERRTVSLDDPGSQDHADVSKIPYSILHDEWKVVLQPQ